MALDVNTEAWGAPESWTTYSYDGDCLKYPWNMKRWTDIKSHIRSGTDLDLSIAPWLINKDSALVNLTACSWYNNYEDLDGTVINRYDRANAYADEFNPLAERQDTPFILSMWWRDRSGNCCWSPYWAYDFDTNTDSNRGYINGERFPVANFRYDKIRVVPVIALTSQDPLNAQTNRQATLYTGIPSNAQIESKRYCCGIGYRIYCEKNSTMTQMLLTVDLDTHFNGFLSTEYYTGRKSYGGTSGARMVRAPRLLVDNGNYYNWLFYNTCALDMGSDVVRRGSTRARDYLFTRYSWDDNNKVGGVFAGKVQGGLFNEHHVQSTNTAHHDGYYYLEVPDHDTLQEIVIEQLAYIGLPFVLSENDVSKAIGDEDVYLPVFERANESQYKTTGEYKSGSESLALTNAEWEWIYDIDPPPPPPAPTIDPVEFYDEYNAEYLSALRQKHRRYKVRLELLGYYENVVGEITRDFSRGSSGSITINNEQITRRSCNLSLINVDKKYLPSPDSPIWFNRKFKLWIGIVTGKHTYWWSYGVFYTTKATCDGNTVNIQGVDKGGALDGTIKTGMLDAENIIERGTTLTNVIKDTLMWNEFSSPYLNHNTGASSYPVDPIAPIVDSKFNSITTQAEITINANDYISTLFSSIADGYGADAYYNTNGHFVFQTMADSNRIDGYRFMAHQWEFKDTDEMYSNASIEYNLDGYNVVTVYTNESTLENVSYTAANNNPASPLRLDSAGIRRMSDIEIPYVNVSQDEMEGRCKAYADYLLMKEAMKGMSITFNCPILPHLDVNRTIGITDKWLGLDDATFVVNSITMPLGAESMTINATQFDWLPDDLNIEG